MTTLLIDYFSTITTSPNGLKRLRQLILELAVRGTLVPQEPEDEPADSLLARIASHHPELKQSIPKQRGSAKDAGYEVPRGWAWTRLGNICAVVMGQSPDGSTYNESGEGVPLINGPVEFSKSMFGFTVKSKWTTAPTKLCDQNDLLICVRGATTGRTNIAGFKACVGRGVAALKPFIDFRYFHYFIVHKSSAFLALGTGTTFPSISRDDILFFDVPVPPFAEQQRIVAKVDELMLLCDQLEKRQGDAEASHNFLVRTLLNALTRSPDGLASTWGWINANFDLLFTTESSVEVLKQTLVQLALMGKLVPQDVHDEPASKLLEAIAQDNETAAARKQRQNRKSDSGKTSEQECTSLPSGWEWASLDALIVSRPQNGYSPRAVDYKTAVKQLTLSATTKGTFDQSKFKYVDEAVPPDSYLWLSPGDVLIQRGNTREYVGIAAVYQGAEHEFIYPDLMIKIRPSPRIPVEYLHLALNCPASRKYFMERASGTSETMPKIAQPTLLRLKIPIAPVAEQHRIIAKVDELMALCNQLRASLSQARSHQVRVSSALIEHVLMCADIATLAGSKAVLLVAT